MSQEDVPLNPFASPHAGLTPESSESGLPPDDPFQLAEHVRLFRKLVVWVRIVAIFLAIGLPPSGLFLLVGAISSGNSSQVLFLYVLAWLVWSVAIFLHVVCVKSIFQLLVSINRFLKTPCNDFLEEILGDHARFWKWFALMSVAYNTLVVLEILISYRFF